MWRDEAYLLDMLLAARKVLSFTEGVSAPQFLSEELRQQAVMRLKEIEVYTIGQPTYSERFKIALMLEYPPEAMPLDGAHQQKGASP